MGRSIVRNPKVFLFDEPLSNLDAKLRVQMRTEIKALHQKLGTTIVYVTHDQIEAMTMADRIVVMNAGHIEQIGTPLDLYDRPVNTFVASFIGSPAMSFISGTCRKRGVGAVVELGDGAALPVNAVVAADGTRVEVGIRPENYVLAENGPLQLKVEVVEPTGPETHIFGQMGGQDVRCVFRIRLDPAPGSILRLTAAPEFIHLFDAATGVRLADARAG
jgi:multiple sugar transport system ATP-binding protein